ncbi:hypothetical protein A9Q91_05900 [Candidatus Gracilibacteria bacterium 28_42_T64]|nr:hypothetical protein A9Q91_05900 [Candidatus Gracilibacteria bacterium 28_42_T64]
MTVEQANNTEIIDNEQAKIIEALDKKEELVALGILTGIDNQIPDYDIDLSIDRTNNTYRFIVDNKLALNIELNLNQIPEMGKFLVEIFNKIDSAELEYDIFFPNDYVDIQIDGDTMFGKLGFDKTVLSTETMGELFGKENTPNDKVREVFKFISTIRNKPGGYKYAINNETVTTEIN